MLISNKVYGKRHRRALHNEKGVNPRRYKMFINMCAPNIGASKYIKQLLTDIKGEIGSIALIVEDFTTPIALMNVDR